MKRLTVHVKAGPFKTRLASKRMDDDEGPYARYVIALLDGKTARLGLLKITLSAAIEDVPS